MKLEYIHDGDLDTSLIRLYEFDTHGAAELHGLVSDLTGGRRTEVALHGVVGVAPVDGCQLVLRAGASDEGVVRLGDAFTCVLTPASWGTVVPFCDKADGNTFQYLDDTGGINLLLSVDGGW